MASNRAAERLDVALRHVVPDIDSSKSSLTARQQDIKWNGWGFNDSRFEVNSHGKVQLTGNRYAGGEMPKLRDWMERECGVNMADMSPSQPLTSAILPSPVINEDFIRAIRPYYQTISFNGPDRLFHGHGHTCFEMYKLRHGSFDRIPDVVVWPASEAHVEAIVQAAIDYNVCIIPYGGGTNVSQALLCPENEQRMIISVDVTLMNSIISVDKTNMTARVQCGIIGTDLERLLAEHGLCTGHEPDSMEFSSLGGWIATRSSGMKKNTYGNIEEILRNVRMVTPTGTMEIACGAPRISAGPDINHFVMGSEGTLGIITEATLRLRPLPQCKRYGSALFPDFESGVAFMREVAFRRIQPASIRLVDNQQFQFGLALKPETASYLTAFMDKAKKFFVTQIKGFKPHEMVACTMLFEGGTTEVDSQEKDVYALVEQYGGMKGGEENGKRGYSLTFLIAYLRDIGMDYYFIAESFETSVPWSNCLALCRNTKDRIYRACEEHGVPRPLVSCRVTQTYDTGACVYFYFGFMYKGLVNPSHTYHAIETAARDEILSCGGSISHHHGIGKLRKEYLEQTVTATGVEMIRAVKKSIDPTNVFACGNLIDV